jgi:hypothetical protein
MTRRNDLGLAPFVPKGMSKLHQKIRGDLRLGSEVIHLKLLKAVNWDNLMYWACRMLGLGCLIYLADVAFGPFIFGKIGMGQGSTNGA